MAFGITSISFSWLGWSNPCLPPPLLAIVLPWHISCLRAFAYILFYGKCPFPPLLIAHTNSSWNVTSLRELPESPRLLFSVCIPQNAWLAWFFGHINLEHSLSLEAATNTEVLKLLKNCNRNGCLTILIQSFPNSDIFFCPPNSLSSSFKRNLPWSYLEYKGSL